MTVTERIDNSIIESKIHEHCLGGRCPIVEINKRLAQIRLSLGTEAIKNIIEGEGLSVKIDNNLSNLQSEGGITPPIDLGITKISAECFRGSSTDLVNRDIQLGDVVVSGYKKQPEPCGSILVILIRGKGDTREEFDSTPRIPSEFPRQDRMVD